MKFIVGKLGDTDAIEAVHPHFAAAFAFLRRDDLKALPAGRYPIAGDDCYAIIADSPLKDVSEGKLEVHEKYIDIQTPLAAVETIGVSSVPTLPTDAFADGKDIVFYVGNFGTVDLAPGDFAVFFPKVDGHAPCLSRTGSKPAQRKVIIKIRD